MPRNLPAQPLTVVPRWDLALWQRLRDTGIQYGDYGITHPQISGPGWRPSPTLRYTLDDAWHIHHRPDSHPIAVADPAFSWGDAELARHAESPEGHRPNWRAWGTSHHLAHVVHHLIGDHGTHAGRR
jgi:hypothetical protein